ncbi:MAG: plastocyanin/azurin family copper-binding protein [Planctomycetota bacterium]|nr:plastocyanin/azurin family copper-binding protein [Planctomycetota bacterium]MDA1263212.1 plastocyanin/azurin family copper-binding protein [Planctomycetota bacterium]
MLVAITICIAMANSNNPPADCSGLDSPSASQTERRSALDACATEAKQKPLDYFLDRIEQLGWHDSRTETYGDIIATWNQDEISQPAIAEKLFSLYKNERASADARVVACRALAGLPKVKRPAEMLPIEQIRVEITTLPSLMAYDRKEFSVAPGCLVHLTLHNPDALEHNFLLVAPNALAEIGIAGDRMGQTPDGKVKEFVPDSKKVLAVLGLVAPGKSKSLWFIAPSKPATYPYVCTYPSHWRTMNGKMKVVSPITPPIPNPESEKKK